MPRGHFSTGEDKKKQNKKLVDGSLAVDETCPLALVNERKKETLTAIHSQRMQYMTPKGDPRSGFHLSSSS